MELTPESLSIAARYKLLTGLVVPRPIAWVSTCSTEGRINLAPFSYFSIVGHAPMALSFSIAGRKPAGDAKDTLHNLQSGPASARAEFVVSLVNEAQAGLMAASAAPLTQDESEFTRFGIAAAASRIVAPPRVAAAPAAFECRVLQIVEIGIARLVIGEVVHLHVDDAVLDEAGRVRFDKLAAVGRLAGHEYLRTSDRFELADAGCFPMRSLPAQRP